jgi:inositol-phosphate transport system substrate-binding protein
MAILHRVLGIGLAAGVLLAAVPQVHAEDVTIRLWSRADRSGPLRAGNIVAATDQLNRMLAATGSSTRVKLEVQEPNAKGYDDDSLELLKAFAVNKGPDMYVLAHEWIGAFAEAGYAWNFEDHIKKNPELYGDIIPILWNSVTYKGVRYGVPQDSEVRMVFVNNDKLRAMGKSEDFIKSLPGQVEKGEFTAADLCDLAAEGVQKGVVKIGLLHRPNTGPDFQMMMAPFGADPYDAKAGKLRASKKGLTNFFSWLKTCVDKKAIPANMTAMSWDSVAAAFHGEDSLMFFHGIWRVGEQMEAFKLKDQAAYFKKLTWLHFPAGAKGGKPANLSHPIMYAVSSKSKNPELAAYIIALASQPVLNTRHAVTTNHTPINYGQSAMPEFVEKGWGLRAGTPMLEYAGFMPNHPKIGPYNTILFKGIEGVETGRLTAAKAVDFVTSEMRDEIGKDVDVVD